jgi:hypothetical protein
MVDKIMLPYINQYIVVLIVGLITLGFAEYFKLYVLGFFGAIITIFISISLILSISYNTLNIFEKKKKK